MEIQISQNGVLFQPEGNSIDVNLNHSVYEVIRVINGIPLFLEDHFKRLVTSVQMSGLHLEMKFAEFHQHIIHLTKLNQRTMGNVRFILSEAHGIYQWNFSFIPHNYPTLEQYEKGVATGLLFIGRENPNAKVIQSSVREKANQFIKDHQLYEALFVDHMTLINEGSRTNLFFIQEDRFYTAPRSSILIGITRNKVMECLDDMCIMPIELAVDTSELEDYDAVFLTGTSPKILPVNCIDDVQYSVKNPYMEQVMARYDAKVEAYLRTHRR